MFEKNRDYPFLKFEPEGTLSVKFGIYMHQMTIFKGAGGVLDNCPTYFLSPYYYLIFYKYTY
jgi:hypothetical protein